MIRLGVTGGIGSGKSTVSQYLARICSGAVLDADAISRKSTAPDGLAVATIARVLGDTYISPDGGLDRTKARQRAFSDPGFRQSLEAIVHPIVQAEMLRIATECAAHCIPLLVYDIPLLAESGKRWRAQLDQVVVIDCSEETQVQRVQSRNHMPVNDVKAIISAQAARAQRLACADMVIFNDGISLLELEKQCQQVSTILRCSN